MKKEYDFSNAERDKFYNADAVFNLPIYLDITSQEFLENIAKRKKLIFKTLLILLFKIV
jgi:hypothetical protein